MHISQIKSVRGHRIFREFSWPSDLHDFGRFNLIYGWNGSGKTTFTGLFSHLERKTTVSPGAARFVINGSDIDGMNLTTAATLPAVRVFNHAFVDASVFEASSPLGPIYTFGEKSVEKQKKLQELQAEIAEVEAALGKAQGEQGSAQTAIDSFCQDQARGVKNLLTGQNAARYNNYNRSDFRKKADALLKLDDASTCILSNEVAEGLRVEKEQRPREALATPAIRVSSVIALDTSVRELLVRMVVSQVIESLREDESLAAWVKNGLGLHPEPDSKCGFCGNSLTSARVQELEGHFNDEYQRFIRDVDGLKGQLASEITRLGDLTLPEGSGLYEQLQEEYSQARTALISDIEATVEYLRGLATAVEEKKGKPFEAVELSSSLSIGSAPFVEGNLAATSLLEVVQKHNTRCTDFESAISTARQRLEESSVAEGLPRLKVLLQALSVANEAIETATDRLKELRPEVGKLERDLIEHRKAADELTQDIHSFLGRDDIVLEAKDTGYAITRSGLPASNLSEGEKSAIALLYFLRSLTSKDFELEKGVVVIDDPVSSLDANSLFSAFGHMKERTKTAAQLFVLTHNFAFFRQVKNWFHHLPKQGSKVVANRPARFFMLTTSVGTDGVRGASLGPLDSLLEEFESEYHYLFKKVYEASLRTDNPPLAEYYSLPNLARRLLEAFLAFRFPSQQGDLREKIDRIDYDGHKRVRIIRFLHTFSHGDKVDDVGHDPTLLGEAPQILRGMFEMMKSEDERHIAEMVKAISDEVESEA